MRAREFINEKAVESAWITHISYNRPNKILTLKVSSGKVYSISNFSRSMFEKWAKSPSKGRFYHDNVKNSYRIVRIK